MKKISIKTGTLTWVIRRGHCSNLISIHIEDGIDAD
jgi:hypothetical protein